MWINLDEAELGLIKTALNKAFPKSAAPTITKIDERVAAAAEAGGWADKARETYGRDGEIEVDEGAVVSHGEDPGAYVMAWLWVTEDEMGISAECEGCSERHPTGVLEDGFCPSCADDEDEDEVCDGCDCGGYDCRGQENVA